MKTLFVSYAHTEVEWRRKVVDTLETPLKHLLNIWIDYSLVAGEEFAPELQRQVQLADGYLVIVSEKYLASEFINNHEWPWIEQELKNGKKLFWIPQDISESQKNSNHILKYLSERQVAYGQWEPLTQLQAKDPINYTAVNNALLVVLEKMRNWAGQTDQPKQATEKPVQFTDKQLKQISNRYLLAMIRTCDNIKTGSLNEANATNNKQLKQLPLDRVYVSLQAAPTTIQERLETRALYHELAYASSGIAGEQTPFQDRLAKIISERPTDSFERASAINPASEEHELKAVFRRERVLVILGDPGSGKSVLCKWIALQMAKAMDNNSGQTELGPPRLPILLRVAKFAEFLKKEYPGGRMEKTFSQPETRNDLYEFLGKHSAEDFLPLFCRKDCKATLTKQEISDAEERISTLCRNAIEDQQAVLLIDGLDEVIDADLRGMVCDAVEQFITEKILPRPGGSSSGRISSFANPGEVGGNQAVLTSRIIGYDVAPLRIETAVHFLIRPLDDEKVADLCLKVGYAVDKKKAGTGEKLLEAIQNRTDHTLERLKRNPLLLTALFTYFVSHNFTLPATRVELYRKLTLDLARRWELTEDTQNNDLLSTRLMQKIRDKLADKSVTERDLFLLTLLAPVADKIHEGDSTGRIERNKLVDIFDRVLKDLIDADPVWDADGDFSDSEQLTNLVAERVGILVEFAPDLFGFLHLTFQEYLTGWYLLYTHNQQAGKPSFLEAFVDRLDDARWREPLLFAFGEFAQENAGNGDTANFLAQLRDVLSVKHLPDESILFMADLLDEIDPRQTTGDEWREVLLALLQGYADCGLRPAWTNRRGRFAEKIAELRRRQPVRVQQQCLAFFNHDDQLACPIAHLFWQRQWLPTEVLAAFSTRQQLDSAAWDWPMYTALSQNLTDNRHLFADPVEKLTPPADDNASGIRLYEAGYGAWQQQQQILSERDWEADCLPDTVFPLRAFFTQNTQVWKNMIADPACLRVLVGLLGAVNNLEAGRWTREYRWISQFLQGADTQRNQHMLADPGKFVPRWGVDDTVYTMAVYLDINPDGRFKRLLIPPELAAKFIVVRLPQAVEQVFRFTEPASGFKQILENGLRLLVTQTDDIDSRALAFIGLALMGLEVSGKPTQDMLDACRRCAHRLRDTVFRVATSQANSWFGLTVKKDEPADINPKLVLDDAQLSIIYNCMTDTAVSALVAPHSLGVGGQNQLAVAAKASLWAYRFSKQADDFVYEFAVMLDTAGPDATGWDSALPLLSRILNNPNLAYVPTLEPTYYPSFWGIVPEEKLIPPAFFQAVEHLAWVAGDFSFDFSWGFGELFLKHLPNSRVTGRQKKWTLVLLGFDLAGLDVEPSMLQRISASMLTQVRQFGEYLPGFDLIKEGDWGSLLQAPHIEEAVMQLELALSDGRIAVSEKTFASFMGLVERLAADSPLDACLFLARTAQYAPADMAQDLLEEALCRLKDVEDDYAKAEFLARFRQIPGGLDVELAKLHQQCCQQLKTNCPILAAHASGQVGRYLCRPEFSWNAADALGTDPSWAVVASYATLSELLSENETRQDLGNLWNDLLLSPDLSKIDDILARAGENGLECTVEAMKTLKSLANRSDLYGSRLVTLLSRPSAAALPLLKEWLEDKAPDAAIFQRQAALLLVERNRMLVPELIDPLFKLREYGDDMTATRVEIALASASRYVEREQRRFSLEKHGVEVVKLLAEQRLANCAQSERQHLARCAGLALNDWQFDDGEALQFWCEQATADSEAENLLLQAMAWVDIWSADSQKCLSAWLLAANGKAGERRHNAFISWAGRLECLKNATLEAEVFQALSQIPVADPSRQLRCFAVVDNKHAEYEIILMALQSLSERIFMDTESFFADAEQQLDASLATLFSKKNSDEPDNNLLHALGCLYYYPIGEFPEDCLPLVFPCLNNHAFMVAVMNWLYASIKNLSDDLNALSDAKSKVEDRKIEALLSFAVCFSERNPSGFIRDAKTRPGLPIDLAKLCYLAPSGRCHMAAVTLITRLDSVSLEETFTLNGNTYTVLDALLYGLHGAGNVQQRIAEVLPKIQGLQGGKVIDKIGELICGAGAANQRGTVVLAAAQLLQRLLLGNTLDSNGRRAAGQLLRKAANAPGNRRPLYRQVGFGGKDDPVTVVYIGDLAEELATLVMKI